MKAPHTFPSFKLPFIDFTPIQPQLSPTLML
jgi:hypothetical protein